MSDNEQAVTVYLCLGSNLSDRLNHLSQAIDLIAKQVKVLRSSPIYETEPESVPNQGKFLNMVVEAQTTLPPIELLQFLKGIEQELGRGTGSSVEPRPIDIDILFYDDLTVSTEALTIPHPRLSQRAFVLVPLNDLVPKLKHPVTAETVAEMLSALDNIRGVELYRPH